MSNNEIKVWWYPVSLEDRSPGTVIIDWPDGGRSVRCYQETINVGKNVWYVEYGDRKFVRDQSGHSDLCNELLQREIQRRESVV